MSPIVRPDGGSGGGSGNVADFGIAYAAPAYAMANFSTFVGGANYADFYRVSYGATISRVRLYVAGSSGNISIGTYANSGAGTLAIPAARTQTTGAIPCPAGGFATVALGGAVVVNPGDWMAMSCDNAVASIGSVSPGGGLGAMGVGMHYLNSASHPLPDPSGISSGPALAAYGQGLILIGDT